MTLRHYLFPEDGKPVRLSQRLTDGLVAGSDWLPDYANTRQRVLTAFLENVDGKPERVVGTEASVWTFDESGGIAEGLRESLVEAMDSLPSAKSSDGTVVSIGPALRRKRLEKKYRWEPTKSELDLVAADIFPQGQPQRLEAAKGASPKKPPLTREARHALREATEPFWRISSQLDDLKEPSLAGFAFEARRRAGEEPDLAPLFLGLAEIADARLAVLRRRRSGKGTWYAFVEVCRWTDRRGQTIACFHERCEGKKAAEQAARRLLIEHAERFAADITVEAGVETDLEWNAAAKVSSGPD